MSPTPSITLGRRRRSIDAVGLTISARCLSKERPERSASTTSMVSPCKPRPAYHSPPSTPIEILHIARSHCDCDLNFRNCLKKVGTEVADQTGRTFFDVLKVPCVQFRRGTNSTGGCDLDDYNCQITNITLVREYPVSYENSRWIWRNYYHDAFNF